MSPTQQEDYSPAMNDTQSSDNSELSDSGSESESEELKQIRAAVPPCTANATPHEVRKVNSAFITVS